MGWPVLKRDHVTKTPKVLFCVREVIKLIFASQQVILFSEIWMKDHLDQCLLILTYCPSRQLEFRAATKLLHPFCQWPASGWCPSRGSCSSFQLPQFFARLSLVDHTSTLSLGSSASCLILCVINLVKCLFYTERQLQSLYLKKKFLVEIMCYVVVLSSFSLL